MLMRLPERLLTSSSEELNSKSILKLLKSKKVYDKITLFVCMDVTWGKRKPYGIM